MPEIDYKIIIWFITILMVIYGYSRYIIDTYSGKTTPHLFSWIIFLIMATLSFLILYQNGAWPWSWAIGFSIITTTIIIIGAFRQWDKNITPTDTVSFVLALISIGLYVFSSDPTYALILIILITSFAVYPTIRKSYYKPTEETMISYVFAGIRQFLGIFAIYEFSFLTLAYPIFLVIMNTGIILLLVIRKKQLWK